jgi:hypothetical protein
MITNDVENYPGFPEKVAGPDLMAAFRARPFDQGRIVLAAFGPAAHAISKHHLRFCTARVRNTALPSRRCAWHLYTRFK